METASMLGHSDINTTMIYFGKKNIMESSVGKALERSFANRLSCI
jgi:site-specific recombinase XerD